MHEQQWITLGAAVRPVMERLCRAYSDRHGLSKGVIQMDKLMTDAGLLNDDLQHDRMHDYSMPGQNQELNWQNERLHPQDQCVDNAERIDHVIENDAEYAQLAGGD
jgi:hypothetical protein